MESLEKLFSVQFIGVNLKLQYVFWDFLSSVFRDGEANIDSVSHPCTRLGYP